jgi:hypothetical protein
VNFRGRDRFATLNTADRNLNATKRAIRSRTS